MTSVLPIESANGLRMDYNAAKAAGAVMKEKYCAAEPFPHIVLDDFLPEEIARLAMRHFPTAALRSDVNFEIGYAGHHKRQILPADCDAEAQALFNFFNSQAMLEFLEALTGIEGLIPDPYFVGGGYHETGKGGKLGIHADFRINRKLHVHRRINVIIYLNENWQEEYGGFLELWDRSMSKKCLSVAPVFNRCVVFNTDADSYHGHPDPLQTPEGIYRRSIALYYYTASRAIYKEVPNKSTIYQARPTDNASIRREAWNLRLEQHINQWVPPALVRYVHAMKRRVFPQKAEY